VQIVQSTTYLSRRQYEMTPFLCIVKF